MSFLSVYDHGRFPFDWWMVVKRSPEPHVKGGRIAVLAAVYSEIAPLQRHMSVLERWKVGDLSICSGILSGSEILVVHTGIGRRNAEIAARIILDGYKVSAVLSVGFGGALSSRLEVGDLVLCRRLMSADPSGDGAFIESDSSLVKAASSLPTEDGKVVPGSSLSVERIILEPVEKHRLRNKYGADVVEMESYWISKLCARRGVPFLGIRAISDSANQLLPNLAGLETQAGSISRAAACRLLTHPGEWNLLKHLIGNLRLAQRRLNLFLGDFVKAGLPEWKIN